MLALDQRHGGGLGEPSRTSSRLLRPVGSPPMTAARESLTGGCGEGILFGLVTACFFCETCRFGCTAAPSPGGSGASTSVSRPDLRLGRGGATSAGFEKIIQLDLCRSLRGRLLPQGAIGGAGQGRADRARSPDAGRSRPSGVPSGSAGPWRGANVHDSLLIGHQAVAYELWLAAPPSSDRSIVQRLAGIARVMVPTFSSKLIKSGQRMDLLGPIGALLTICPYLMWADFSTQSGLISQKYDWSTGLGGKKVPAEILASSGTCSKVNKSI